MCGKIEIKGDSKEVVKIVESIKNDLVSVVLVELKELEKEIYLSYFFFKVEGYENNIK